MLIKNHLEDLREQFELKTNELIAAEQQLWQQGNGFFDKSLLDKLADARAEFQKAETEYQKFLTLIIQKKLNIDAEM